MRRNWAIGAARHFRKKKKKIENTENICPRPPRFAPSAEVFHLLPKTTQQICNLFDGATETGRERERERVRERERKEEPLWRREKSARSCGFLYVFLAIVKCVEYIAHWSCAAPFHIFTNYKSLFYLCAHTYKQTRVCVCVGCCCCPKLDN